eukprot:11163989-Lingulodinium_polyedra.AAC.1
MASSAGSAGSRPVRVCPAVRRLRSARRSMPGAASRRTPSQRGHRRNRCSGSSSPCAQCGQVARP